MENNLKIWKEAVVRINYERSACAVARKYVCSCILKDLKKVKSRAKRGIKKVHLALVWIVRELQDSDCRRYLEALGLEEAGLKELVALRGKHPELVPKKRQLIARGALLVQQHPRDEFYPCLVRHDGKIDFGFRLSCTTFTPEDVFLCIRKPPK